MAESTATIKIYRDGELIKEFNNQETDMEAFAYMLRSQGQSVDWALKYGGYKVEVIDEQTGAVSYWKSYAR